MYTATTSRRFLAASLIAGVGVVFASIAPASAMVEHLNSATTTHSKAHASKIPVRCKTRNKASGTIRYSDWQFPDNLNEYITQASVSTETISSEHDGLIQFNGQGKAYPVILAKLPSLKNGEIRDGGKTVVATLKKGLRWSNGAEITSADVKFSWKVQSDPKSGPNCLGTCDAIARIDTPNKYTLVFHLKHVYAPFVTNGLPDVWPVQWPGGWAKNDVSAAVNKLFQDQSFNFEGPNFPFDGAYITQTFNKDDRIVLAPNKYYSTMTCGAKVAQLIFAFYASKPALIAAAANKETDATTDYTLADIPQLMKYKSFKTYNNPGFLIEHLTFNLDPQYNGAANPLTNIKVRQALALALNKYGVIESALGMSKAQADTIISWTPLILTKQLKQAFADTKLKGQWDPIAKKYQINTGSGQALADAKKLLSQAGFGSGFTLDGYTTSGNPVRQAQFSVIQQSWQQISVNFKPNYVPASKLFGSWVDGGVLQHGAFQVAMYADVGYPDPDGFHNDFESNYIDREKATHSDVNANVAGIHDKSFDQAFSKASSSFDPKVRQKWYNVWQVGLNQKAYWVPLFYRGEIDTADNKIGNFVPNPTNAGLTWNTWQWVVKGHAWYR